MSKPIDPRLLRMVPAARRLVAALAGVQALNAALVIVQAVSLATAIVDIAHGHLRVGLLVVLGAAAAGRAVLGAVQSWLTARASVRIRASLRRRALESVVGHGPAWARRRSPGSLVNAAGPGLEALDSYFTSALPALVAAAVVPPAVLIAITWADWSSGVLLLVLLPLIPLFMVLIGITTQRLVDREYRVLSRLSGQFLDLVRGLPTLRVYGRAGEQQQTLATATDGYRRHTMATLRIALLSGLVLDLAAALSVAVVAVDVGLRLDSGGVPFVTALAVLILAPELFAPLRAVGAAHHAAQEGAAALDAVLDVLHDEASAPLPHDVPVTTGALLFDGVRAGYEGRPDPALSVDRLHIEPGAVVALTGVNGSGKSTALAALLGFTDTVEGDLLVGTSDDWLRAGADVEAIRAAVAWLPQRPRCSCATVGDEIRLGDPDASDREIAELARRCQTPPVHTEVGEDGSAVSAGQRRRVALARTLLRARRIAARGAVPIVALDEPTEELDSVTAAVVGTIIDAMRGWATVLVATHDERVTALCDLEVRLAGGRLIDIRSQDPETAPRMPHAAPAVTVAAADDAGEAATVDPLRIRDLVRAGRLRRRLAGAMALAAAGGVVALALTATSMWLISRAAQHPNVQALAIAVVGVRLFAVSRAVLRYAERLITHDVALRLLATLRVRVFAGLRPLTVTRLHRYGRGELLRRFVGDVDSAQEGLVRAIVPAAGAAAGGLAAVVLAWSLLPVAGVVLFAALILAAGVVPWAARVAAGSRTLTAELAGRRDRRTAALLDSLDELVAFDAATPAVAQVVDLDEEVCAGTARPALASAVGSGVSALLGALTLPVLLWTAVSAVRSGQLPMVDVAVLAVCALAGFEAVAGLPAALVAWTGCRAGLARVAEVIDAARPATAPERDSAGETVGLQARGLTVAPADGAAVVVRDADWDLLPGRRLALVGPSGCGKSTVVAAVFRLLSPRAGTLRVTGARDCDVAEVAEGAYPSLVAGSLQGDHVFDATLRDNLRVVRPEATDAELDAVARRVGFDDVVAGLPRGWDTPAGTDGDALSGGQRQRLLLARALLHDPAVLVLDEPTAHLDGEAEERVLDDVLSATAGRTVLLTSHRRAALSRVDVTLQVENGTVGPIGSAVTPSETRTNR